MALHSTNRSSPPDASASTLDDNSKSLALKQIRPRGRPRKEPNTGSVSNVRPHKIALPGVVPHFHPSTRSQRYEMRCCGCFAKRVVTGVQGPGSTSKRSVSTSQESCSPIPRTTNLHPRGFHRADEFDVHGLHSFHSKET